MIDHQLLSAVGARRIAIDTEPGELDLPPETERRLGWLASWLTQPPQVFREWGLQHFIDGGLRALFRGAPGTGKTMAAVALAKGVERPLLHIDLAAVVSEYVSETEKNLEALLAAADEEGAILLFDEADALFAERSEVHDAPDRYANQEVALLLRRIETFQGLAILASNRNGNIDQGTASRIDVLVDFPMPDEMARQQIWMKLLRSVKLPRSDELDVGPLARHELSGADILRCVRMAALLAASEEEPLAMEHLKAAALERVKLRDG